MISQVMAWFHQATSHYQDLQGHVGALGQRDLTHWILEIFFINLGVGGAVRFLVVGTIGQEERPPQGQLWMEQCLTSLKYWPI